jgi:cytoskeletal protein CcmA (bactofilin family)
MLYSNSNSERSPAAERQFPGAAAAGREAPAEDSDAARIPVLGKTLLFRGELTAEEDVILQGRVEGSIRHARNLIIGIDGSVLGDVYASHLTVEGLVEGDLHCSEAVIVRATAQVRGNIFAPRVGIMEGATFNGRIEMDAVQAGQQASPRAEARPAAPRAPGQGAAPARAAVPPGTRGTPPAAAPGTQAAVSAPAGAGGGPLANAAVDQMLGSSKK